MKTPFAALLLLLTFFFQKGPAVAAVPEEIPWSSTRPLRWEDFRGPVPFNPGRTAAETACAIGYEAEISSRKAPVRLRVYNAFSTERSWVRSDARKPEILQHEQGHFDICELFTRELRRRFHEVSPRLTVDNMKSIINDVYSDVQRDYRKCQERYERDTAHGVNREAQDRWTVFLAEELRATEASSEEV